MYGDQYGEFVCGSWGLEPVKDQKLADEAKTHLSNLSKKIDHILQPVFTSQKIGDLKMREPKQPLINQQCMVYNHQCV